MQDADEGRENGERRKTLNIQHSPPRPAFQGGTAGSTTMLNVQVRRGERQSQHDQEQDHYEVEGGR